MELPIVPTVENAAAHTDDDIVAERLGEESPTDALIPWALERLANFRMVITSAFGMEGCAMIDMFARCQKPLRVVYMDTMFFFPETYTLRDRLVERYPHLDFVNVGTDMTPEQQAEKYGDKLWQTNPNECCRIRKVEPMARAMKDVDVWATSLRRSQSSTRANTRVLSWDWKFQVIKFCPLAYWTREQIWEYIKENDVPYNPLHENGYPTIGCTHCTNKVEGAGVTDYTRAGRWSGMEKTECGLHGDGI